MTALANLLTARLRAGSAASGRWRRIGATLATFAVVVTMALGIGVGGLADPAAAATRPGSALGIDVASHQHPGGVAINWRSVRASGVRFVLVKATEGAGRAGTDATNHWFGADWSGAQAAGLLRGAYHYARPRLPLSSAASDARRFVAVIRSAGHGGGELAPVLDLEVTGGLGAKNLSAWTAAWLTEVTRLTGRTPTIYTGRGFWTSYLGNTSRFAGYPLWYANHTTAARPSALPGGWSAWSYWQYSASGRVAGIRTSVDLSWSCGAPGTPVLRAARGSCTGAPLPSHAQTTTAKRRGTAGRTMTATRKVTSARKATSRPRATARR